jgi:acyl-CoA thioester hydrolase
MKTIKIDVEFEDLDAGGVVYHPNYIKLCERARNRWFAEHGITFGSLKSQDVALAIRSIKADYLRPVLHEAVNIKMAVINQGEKSVTIVHEIFPVSSQNRAPHFSAEITLVAANYSTGRSCSLPDEVKQFLALTLSQATP